MKKLILSIIAAALVMGGGLGPAHAADRVTKVVKICQYSLTSVTADAVLVQPNGATYCDVSDMIVERITLEHNVTSLTGTSVVFKVITTSDPTNLTGATTDAALLGSDGSTAFVSATLTTTGRGSRGTSVPVTGTSGLGMNLGTKIGVWADDTAITVLDGTVFLTIFGRR